MFEDIIKVDFCGYRFKAPANYDHYLKNLYGDYMEIPPLEKRELHVAYDIVLIHDAIRPMISADIISDCIRITKEKGNATTVIPCAEAMLKTENGENSTGSYPRDFLKRTQTPQGFHVGDICDLHRRALAAGITNSVASCTLMIELGEKVYFSVGSEKNIKLTTVEDIDIFKALLIAKRSDWLK